MNLLIVEGKRIRRLKFCPPKPYAKSVVVNLSGKVVREETWIGTFAFSCCCDLRYLPGEFCGRISWLEFQGSILPSLRSGGEWGGKVPLFWSRAKAILGLTSDSP